MRFRVKSMQSDFSIRQQDIEADDVDEVGRILAAAGARLLSATPDAAVRLRAGRDGFQLAVFNQQLHSLLQAGQTVVDALEILAGNDVRGRQRRVFDTLLQGLRSGRQLSDSMTALPSVFPALYIAMLRASETTGAVPSAVQRYSQYQRQVDDVRRKLMAAAMYPAVLLCVGFLVIAFLLLFVVPRFSAVFDDIATARHGSAGFIQVWGGFVRAHGGLAWGLLLGLVAGGVAVVTNRALRGRVTRWLLRAPFLGEKLHLLQLARTYRTLGMLLSSGVSVLAAMRMTAETLNAALREALLAAAAEVATGKTLSGELRDHGLCTEVAYRLLIAGESSGNLDDMMGRIADFYDQDLTVWIDTAGRLIEPILMVAIGLVIGAVLLMLYMPIFDLTSAI